VQRRQTARRGAAVAALQVLDVEGSEIPEERALRQGFFKNTTPI
jgi:hypothetical protein